MNTLKKGANGMEVLALQKLLNEWNFVCQMTAVFDQQTEQAVKKFQQSQSLTADGIVGSRTWKILKDEKRIELLPFKLKESDFEHAAKQLNVEVATIKAVQEVETGGQGGFVQVGYPVILFEGHIFWSQLKRRGKNPNEYVKGNEDILHPNWTKQYYKGGMAEYERMGRAKKIDDIAASCSASYGMWQIMGFNYEVCGCKDVYEFIMQMQLKEGTQLDLFVKFLQTNKWDKYLREKNWAEFARHYNGPSYRQNNYDQKLSQAYMKHLG